MIRRRSFLARAFGGFCTFLGIGAVAATEPACTCHKYEAAGCSSPNCRGTWKTEPRIDQMPPPPPELMLGDSMQCCTEGPGDERGGRQVR